LTNFSSRERNALIRLRASGTSVKHIADAFGCTANVVYSATKSLSTSRSLSSSVRQPSQAATLRPPVPAPSPIARTTKKRKPAANQTSSYGVS
jgi:hypothetical protein